MSELFTPEFIRKERKVATDSKYLAALDTIESLQSDVVNLASSLSALRERTRWIPVSEKLPLPAQKRDGYMSDSSELVHVYPSPNYDRAVCYLHYLEKWSCSAEVTPTHWRPIDLPDEADNLYVGDSDHEHDDRIL